MGFFRSIILLSLSGCAPYVEYTHLDPTPFHNDDMAYDLVCVGGETEDRLSVDTAMCKNVRGGEMLKINVRYML